MNNTTKQQRNIKSIRLENMQKWTVEDFDFYASLHDEVEALLQGIYQDKTPSKQKPSKANDLD